MLTFRNTSIFFGLLFALIVPGIFFLDLPVWWILIAMFLYLSVLFYGSYSVGSGFYMPVVCGAETTEKKIAISFDDGPDEKYTPDILSILKQYDTEAAFFCIGRKIPGREKMLQQIADNGHIIGNHSYSHHFWFSMFSSEDMISELSSTDLIIEKATGFRPQFFRPPYGVTNPNIRKAVAAGNYQAIGWSVRSMDTVIRNQNKLLGRLIDSIRPGAVFLFHDTSQITVSVLPKFLNEVRSKGYSIERLDRLLNLKAYV